MRWSAPTAASTFEAELLTRRVGPPSGLQVPALPALRRLRARRASRTASSRSQTRHLVQAPAACHPIEGAWQPTLAPTVSRLARAPLRGTRQAPRTGCGIVVAAASSCARCRLAPRHAPSTSPTSTSTRSSGRSIAEHGRPLVRGSAAHFPAAAPAAPDRPGVALRATSGLLSGRPARWARSSCRSQRCPSSPRPPARPRRLARRSESPRSPSRSRTCSTPAWVLADPFAYPLALAALAAGTAALARPTRRSQVAFVGLRGARDARARAVRRPPRLLPRWPPLVRRSARAPTPADPREQRLVFGSSRWPRAVLVAGPEALLGYYDSVLDLRLDPLRSSMAAADAMLFLVLVGMGVRARRAPRSWARRCGAPLARRARPSASSPPLSLARPVPGRPLRRERANRCRSVTSSRSCRFVPSAPLRLYAAGFRTVSRTLSSLAGARSVSARVPLAGFAASDGKSNSPLLSRVGQSRAADRRHRPRLARHRRKPSRLLSSSPRRHGRLLAAARTALRSPSRLVSLSSPRSGPSPTPSDLPTSYASAVLWPDPPYVDHA